MCAAFARYLVMWIRTCITTVHLHVCFCACMCALAQCAVHIISYYKHVRVSVRIRMSVPGRVYVPMCVYVCAWACARAPHTWLYREIGDTFHFALIHVLLKLNTRCSYWHRVTERDALVDCVLKTVSASVPLMLGRLQRSTTNRSADFETTRNSTLSRCSALQTPTNGSQSALEPYGENRVYLRISLSSAVFHQIQNTN